MKNKLAENMLRFGVKNLKESDVKKIEESILTEQAVTSLEAAFTDPRITQTADIAQKNEIIWGNLISYYSTGVLGKDVVGWLKNAQYGAKYDFQSNSQVLSLEGITAPIAKFNVQDIFKGKNSILMKGGQVEEGELECIFICKDKMTVAGPNGNQGTLYPLSYDPAEAKTKTIEDYKSNGLPMGAHFRVIGNKVYYFPNVYGKPDARNELFTPISDRSILALIS